MLLPGNRWEINKIDMTTTILFYILGTITGMMFFSIRRLKSKYSKIKSKYDNALIENKELKEFRSEKQSKKRKAKYKSVGWYRVADKANPNRPTWDVVYELKEVAQSQDGSKFQFDVLGVFSENLDDEGSVEFYTNHFKSKNGGGWLDKDDFEWITTTSKEEERDDKLEQLGIK